MADSTALTWNAFQRANKGRGWSKQEMSEQWAAYKQQQQHGHAKQQKQAAQGVQSTLTALWLRSRGHHRPASTADVACAADTAGVADAFSPMSPLTPSTCSSSCSTPVRLRPVAQPSSPAPAAAAAAAAACTPPAAADTGAGWRFPAPSEVSASPSPSPGPTLADIAQLRAAVVHLLSASKARPGASNQGQEPAAIACGLADEEQCKPAAPAAAAWVSHAAPAAADRHQPQQQQQQQQQRCPPPAASVGCFGSLGRRPPMSWNAFQRACAGRGLTKTEMSAAWAAYKSTGQLPAGDGAAAPPQPPGPGRWGSIKEWVSSRVNSQVSSRAASRAASRVVSPTSSPAKQPAGLQRQQSTAQQQLSTRSDSDYLEQQQQLLELQLHEAQAASAQQQQQQWRWRTAGTSGSSTPCHAVVAAAAAVAPGAPSRPPCQPPQGQAAFHAGARLFHWGGSCVASVTGIAPGRRLREAVPDTHPGLAGFGPWHPVRLHNLKLLKRAIPSRPGLYEWGARLPLSAGDTAAAAAAAGEGTQAGEQQALGPVVCFYLGKAGSLRARLPAGRGEVLRTRFNKYALTKARRLGPAAEPHKDGLFEALQAAGAQLCYRWWVAAGVEPRDMERRLLEELDYAANLQHNGKRRPLLLAPTPGDGQCCN